MLDYLEDSSQRRWLTGLLVAWTALLFGGFLLGSEAGAAQRMPAWTRMGSSVVLVALAWSWFVFGRRGPTGRFALLLAAGMTCGLVGDLVLAGQRRSLRRVHALRTPWNKLHTEVGSAEATRR